MAFAGFTQREVRRQCFSPTLVGRQLSCARSIADIATGPGPVAGGIVVVSPILMGGELHMFLDIHAANRRMTSR